MTPNDKLRMAFATERIMNDCPGRGRAVMELKKKYSDLYELEQERFTKVLHKALALNVRNGSCNSIRSMREALELHVAKTNLPTHIN